MYHQKCKHGENGYTYITTEPSLLCPLRLKFLQELQTTHDTTANFFLELMGIMVQRYGLPSELPFLVSPACTVQSTPSNKNNAQ